LYYTEGVFLHEKANAGTYRQTIKLKAQPDPDCDPSQQFCINKELENNLPILTV
jgi:hypothetical protein